MDPAPRPEAGMRPTTGATTGWVVALAVVFAVLAPILLAAAGSLLLPAAHARFHWPDGRYNPYDEVPLRVHVNASNLTDDADAYLAAVDRAMAWWETEGQERLAWNVSFNRTEDRSSAHILLWFVDETYVPCTRPDGDATGCGGFGSPERKGIVSLALRSEPNRRFRPYEAIEATAVHEIGHALGLPHSSVEGDPLYHASPPFNPYAPAPGSTEGKLRVMIGFAVATLAALGGLVWFYRTQLRDEPSAHDEDEPP